MVQCGGQITRHAKQEAIHFADRSPESLEHLIIGLRSINQGYLKMPLDPVATLQKLVSLPSVNPMGSDIEGPIYRESRVTAYLQSLFEGLGLPWVRDTVEPDRDNIVIRLDGDLPGLMVWEVHQDTVPVEGMTIDPFGGELRENRI